MVDRLSALSNITLLKLSVNSFVVNPTIKFLINLSKFRLTKYNLLKKMGTNNLIFSQAIEVGSLSPFFN